MKARGLLKWDNKLPTCFLDANSNILDTRPSLGLCYIKDGIALYHAMQKASEALRHNFSSGSFYEESFVCDCVLHIVVLLVFFPCMQPPPLIVLLVELFPGGRPVKDVVSVTS